MSFTNVYYKRAVGTAKSCFVCYRPTTTVLATINTVDFIYTCPSHLTDHNFATRIPDDTTPAAKSSVSPEEIAKIKQEWEEKQKKKKEKEKEEAKDKEKEKDKGEEAEKKDKKDSSGSKEGSKSPPIPPTGSTTPSKATSTHEQYALHRDFYAMRQLEHKKRRQAAQAKDLAPRLPPAPRSSISLPQPDKY